MVEVGECCAHLCEYYKEGQCTFKGSITIYPEQNPLPGNKYVATCYDYKEIEV